MHIKPKINTFSLLLLLFAITTSPVHRALAIDVLLQEQRLISITARETIEVPPDMVHISYHITQQHRNDISVAKANMEKISSDSARRLIALGVSEDDIRSSAVNIDQGYERTASGEEYSTRVVSRRIDVTIRDVDIYDDVIKALAKSGITRLNNARFDVTNRDELRQQALTKAIEKSKVQAEFLAEQFDAKVHRMHRIGRQSVQPHFQPNMLMAERAGLSDAAEPYQFKLGNIRVDAEIHVQFEIK